MITIEHSHAGGTVVHGTSRNDGTNLVIKNTRDGWRFSRNIGTEGAWYLPRSRDRHPDTVRIDRLAAALRDAGYEVGLRVDYTPRAATDIDDDRAEQLAGRVQRYTELAETRHTSGAARMDAVRDALRRIPLGQPILSVRDANYRDELHRREKGARAELTAAEHWQHRAKAAQTTQRYRHNSRVTLRRIATLEADQRGWQRRLDLVRPGGRHGEYAESGPYAGHAPGYIEQAQDEIARLAEQITHWYSELEALKATGQWAPWQPHHLRAGDEVKILGTWYPVLRVNKKSLTISPLVFGGQRRLDDNGKDTWTDTVRYDKVYGRRRDGFTLHTPPPAEGATCTERLIIPTFNAEFIPETDGGPCASAPVVRVTIHHNGASCGCNGLYLFDPEAGTRLGPWTEVRLWCAAHHDEYEAEARKHGQLWPPADNVERLT